MSEKENMQLLRVASMYQ